MEPFFAARRAAGVSNLRTRASLAPLPASLRRLGVVTVVEMPAPASEAERLLAAFRTYLTRERGLAEGTVVLYVRIARLLVDERASGGEVDLCELTARELPDFDSLWALRGRERRGFRVAKRFCPSGGSRGCRHA